MRRAVILSAAMTLLAAAPAMADDPIKDIVDAEVPALKDGTKIPLADVQQAMLDAMARRKFAATVDGPGLITARWEHGRHWFEVAVLFSDTAYSVTYKNSEHMDYNAAKKRIDDAYNEYVAGLNEHIEAQLERRLDLLKAEQKRLRKASR